MQRKKSSTLQLPTTLVNRIGYIMKYKSTIFVTNPIGKGKFKLIDSLGDTEKESYDNVMYSFESKEYWKHSNTVWITANDIGCIETENVPQRYTATEMV